MQHTEKEILAGLNRRTFMRASGAAALTALLGREPQALLADDTKKIEAKADTVILLWMAGGMAQTETFDPKAYTPFKSGLESKRVLSTFPPIPTAVDGVQIS